MVRSRFMGFLGHGRTGYGPSPRARQSAQSTDFETLLIAAQCSGRVAEAARYIVLICVSRLEKLNHGVSFGGAIFHRVMGEDNTVDEQHSLALLSFDTNAIVYEDGTRGRNRTGEKLHLIGRSRAHGFLACPIPTDSKSGQFKVRTQECENRAIQPRINKGTYGILAQEEPICCHVCCGYIQAPINA